MKGTCRSGKAELPGSASVAAAAGPSTSGDELCRGSSPRPGGQTCQFCHEAGGLLSHSGASMVRAAPMVVSTPPMHRVDILIDIRENKHKEVMI